MREGPWSYGINLATGTLLLIVAVTIAGCVTPASTVQTEMGSLKQAVFQNQKNIKELEGKTTAVLKDLKEIKSVALNLPKEESLSAMRDSQASLYTQVSDALNELQILNGRLDEFKHLFENNMDKTTAELEVVKSKLDSTSAPPNLENLTNRLTNMEADIAFLKGKVEALSALARGVDDITKASPKDFYEEGLALFNEKKYDKARAKMREFIKKYPKHELAGNAQFWTGECYYAIKAYDDAILAYEEVLQKYKDSPKIPAAMLKQGYAFLMRGDTEAAKVVLRNLIKKYPKDKMSDTARRKLKELK